MAVEIQLRASGPLFDGRAQKAVKDYLLAATGAVAGEGVNLVQASGRADYKNPTGYYESHIVTDLVEPDSTRVWDSEVIYGPWLEGTSARNQTTRFKGYATFRRAYQQLDRRAQGIAYRMLERFVARMNG
jgi:hypothetical protein